MGWNPQPGDVVCDCRYTHQKITTRDGDDLILDDGLACSLEHCCDPPDHEWKHPNYQGQQQVHMRQVEWAPTRWWRSVSPDGDLWIESSDEEEVRREARPGDRIENLWQTVQVREWRAADD